MKQAGLVFYLMLFLGAGVAQATLHEDMLSGDVGRE